MASAEAEEKGLLYYFKAASIILGVLITVTGIYAAAFKFVYGSRQQGVDVESLESYYAEFQEAVIDSISASNKDIRELKIDFEKSDKARIDELKLMNQKINAIIQAVPNNKELVRKIDEIHYFYQQWHEDEKKNSKKVVSQDYEMKGTQ